MLSSQVLETSIGIIFLLLILATAASAVLDLIRRALNTRSKDLEKALKALFDGSTTGDTTKAAADMLVTIKKPELAADATAAWERFKKTSVYLGAAAARGQVVPAYLSAKSFAEAVEELLRNGDLPTGPLGDRIKELYKSIGRDTLAFRAGIERWFDETMAGLTSRYRKRSTVWLFLIGVLLAVGLNVSVPYAAQELWRDSATRAAVVAAAEGYTPPAASDQQTAAETIDGVAGAAAGLDQLGIPVGWGSPLPGSLGGWALLVAGWLLTAALISLGAPFWFDLLNRLTAIRSPKPATAADDETSATNTKSANQLPSALTPLPALPTLGERGLAAAAEVDASQAAGRVFQPSPANLAELQAGAKADPPVEWDASQRILLRDGSRARWTGSDWENA